MYLNKYHQNKEGIGVKEVLIVNSCTEHDIYW